MINNSQVREVINKSIDTMNDNDARTCTIHAHPNIVKAYVQDEMIHEYFRSTIGKRKVPIKENQFIESIMIRVDN